MSRLVYFILLFRLYRQIHGPINAARYAWAVSGG
jgi:hypothetical protein